MLNILKLCFTAKKEVFYINYTTQTAQEIAHTIYRTTTANSHLVIYKRKQKNRG